MMVLNEPGLRLEHPVVAFGADALSLLDRAGVEADQYWRGFLQEGARAYAPNLDVPCGVIIQGGSAWPLTLASSSRVNSYPCSLLTQYVRYPLEELGLVKRRGLRALAWLSLQGLGGLLRAGQIDKTVQWSSRLLSTNPHPSELKAAILPVTRELCRAFPGHAVLVKNIDPFLDPELPARFEAAGYTLITSRQVYYFDGRNPAFLGKSTVKRDLRALAQLEEHTPIEHAQITSADVPRITELYHKLYVHKHSSLNPRYTGSFVARALEERWMEFQGLRHQSGRLDAVCACYCNGGIVTAPFIGHDTSLPVDAGLYRHLVSLLLQRVAQHRQVLNYSSGAGDFKRRRGGLPVIEFNAIYADHLPPWRRAVFRLLACIANGPVRRFLETEGV
jgi:hypothetical protein